MIPDIVQDNITDAAKRCGYKFTEQVFYLYALDSGHTGEISEKKARELDTLWKRQGYIALPQAVKDFVLRLCDGERR